MIRIIGLDKKLFTVQHKMTPTQLMEMKMPEEELKKLIQQNIYNKVVQLLSQTTKVRQYTDENGFTWEFKMFILSDREMWGVLLETLELNEEDRLYMIEECKKMLGMFTP